MNTGSLLKQLSPYSTNANSDIANCANRITTLTSQVTACSVSLDMFKELTSEIDYLKTTVTTADDIQSVQSINDIFNNLVLILNI